MLTMQGVKKFSASGGDEDFSAIIIAALGDAANTSGVNRRTAEVVTKWLETYNMNVEASPKRNQSVMNTQWHRSSQHTPVKLAKVL